MIWHKEKVAQDHTWWNHLISWEEVEIWVQRPGLWILSGTSNMVTPCLGFSFSIWWKWGWNEEGWGHGTVGVVTVAAGVKQAADTWRRVTEERERERERWWRLGAWTGNPSKHSSAGRRCQKGAWQSGPRPYKLTSPPPSGETSHRMAGSCIKASSPLTFIHFHENLQK